MSKYQLENEEIGITLPNLALIQKFKVKLSWIQYAVFNIFQEYKRVSLV